MHSNDSLSPNLPFGVSEKKKKSLKSRLAFLVSLALIATSACQISAAPVSLDNGTEEAVGESPEKTLSASETVSVDDILDSMSLERKIEQLLMPNFRTWKEGDGDAVDLTEFNEEVTECISNHNFGGVILYSENTKGTRQTANLTNAINVANASLLSGNRVPLFISIDQEGGRVTRLNTGTSGCGNMALGASLSEGNVRDTGAIIGEELSSLGINVDFSPVVDVNNNPSNPIINVRSFSSDPELVSKMGPAYIEGLHSAGVMAALKHFPGHGDTDTDSHTGLPMVRKTLGELESCELLPFEAGIAAGADMIMTAHIQYPEIEKETYVSTSTGEEVTVPATLSKTILTDLLREKMGFDGVIVTDALEMDAIAKHFDPMDTIRMAINAGADLILVPFATKTKEDLAEIDTYIDNVEEMVEDGSISENDIDDSVRRILTLKEKNGMLSDIVPEVDPDEAVGIVGSKEHHDREWEIALQGVTLLKNSDDLLPIDTSDGEKTAIFASKESEVNSIRYAISKLQGAAILPLDADIPIYVYQGKSIEDFEADLKGVDRAIALSCMNNVSWIASETDGSDAVFLDGLIQKMHEKDGKAIIISEFLPYDAARFTEADAILACYSPKDMPELPDYTKDERRTYGPNIPAAVATVYGLSAPAGKLPVDIPKLDDSNNFTDSVLYKQGTGLSYSGEDRFIPLDYALSKNWIAYSEGEDKKVDVFWVSPTVSMNSYSNISDSISSRQLLGAEYKREEGLYSSTGRMFAPFYREMGILGYTVPTREKVLSRAYGDVSKAFDYYLKHENNGRGIILAGYSQGADMCYRLLEEYFGGDSEQAKRLRESLVAVYGLGWAMTDDMIKKYPQIVPATGELDTGVVVSFECEDDREPTISGNIIIPAGKKMISINPLNWKTDGSKADKSLNLGAAITKDGSVTITPSYCGAYINSDRGCLKVTDLTGEVRFLGALGKGSLHLYDYSFFYVNLRKNVADRTRAFLIENGMIDPNETVSPNGTASGNQYASSNAAQKAFVSANLAINANGAAVSINLAYTASVSYNGKKHVTNFDKVKKNSMADITVSLNSSLLSFAEPKFKFKYNRDVVYEGTRYPRFVLFFKAKGATKEQKKQLRAVNKKLKKTPFMFDITPAKLSDAESIKVDFNGNKSEVKKVTATFNGTEVKLKKKDFEAAVNQDGSVTLKGKRNFTGEVRV